MVTSPITAVEKSLRTRGAGRAPARFFCAALILPTRRVPVRRMLAGGLLFAGALVAGQVAFKALTARSVAQYNLVYGSLASLMLGAIWIFYFFQMFLILIYWTGKKHGGLETPKP